jgi:hypothetical protein
LKNGSLAAAAVVVAVANGSALFHAARNRMGVPDAAITLTERELRMMRTDDNSGVTLMLNFQDPSRMFYYPESLRPEAWLSREKLSTLGFDCGVDPSDKRAPDFYERQVPRSAFVALEYDGLAWHHWQETNAVLVKSENRLSRLVAIDAAPNAAQLRARYPDRHSILIQPAVIRISFRAAVPNKGWKAQIAGSIDSVSRSIHVPQPFSSKLRTSPIANPASYRVNLTFGSALEPWVTGVETGVEPEAPATGRPRQ